MHVTRRSPAASPSAAYFHPSDEPPLAIAEVIRIRKAADPGGDWGGDDDLRRRYLEARERFALVVIEAKTRRRYSFLWDDLVQAGFTGLLRAVDGYDPDHPSQAGFVTYARRAIRNEMTKVIRRIGHPVSLSWSDRRHPMMISEMISTSVLSPHLIALEDETRDVGRWFDHEDLPGKAALALSFAKGPQRRYLELRFGLDGSPERDLSEVGRLCGVSKQAVHQSIAAATSRISRVMAAEGVGPR